MTTSAIYIQSEIDYGYGHVYVNIGSIDLDERTPAFHYVSQDCSAFYGVRYQFLLSCQIGSGNDRSEREYPAQREPYAINYLIDPRACSRGIDIAQMATLAKATAKLQRSLAKVAAKIGEPESFEDHALALFLATKPQLLVTKKGRDWTERDATTDATADKVRQAVRHAVADIKTKLFPETRSTEEA